MSQKKVVTYAREVRRVSGLPPANYSAKFASLEQAIQQCQAESAPLLVAYPQVLGDNYEELLESLSQLAAAKVPLLIVNRADA